MTPFLQVEDLSKRFPGSEEEALSHISAKIPQAQMIGLVGPDGSGKTTLIRLMASLLTPSQGSITLLGKDSLKEAEEIRSLIGYMPQKFGLYEELSVVQNLNLYFELQSMDPALKEPLFHRLLQFTRLAPFQDRLARDLSGGMKQKLGLACALLKKPTLLLLDEPSVGVDPLSRRELWKMVHDLIEEGISVIWSTAYLDEAEKCDKILLMNRGKLLFYGPPKEILKKVEGRTFLIEADLKDKRALFKEISHQQGVLDATVQGNEIRVVIESGREKSLEPYVKAKKVEPRLEDAFIDLLGGIPRYESRYEQKKFTLSEMEYPIQIRGLTKRFGSFTAVDQISCQIRKGEVFGLLGPNGAGKSTTFKMLCGLLEPSSGEALVLGMDLKKSRAVVRQKMGYMAQKFSLYGHISVRQNLAFFAGIYLLKGEEKERVIAEMVEMFGLGPHLETSADELPLGFKQRLSLACATLHAPEILFLDEPTSGVDPIMRREFWHHIHALVGRGVTVMITTHFMDEAEYCDRIALIYQGKMIHTGSPDELKKEANKSTLEEAFIHLIQEYDRV